MTLAPDRPTAVRAVLVDDHQLLAESLAMSLRFEGVACTVAGLSDRASLVAQVLADPPDLVLLDLDLGEVIGDGSELVAQFTAAGCRVLVVSASTDHDQVCRAIEHGAVGIVRKDVPFQLLQATALAAARGEEVLCPDERRRILAQARATRTERAERLKPFEWLTAREAEVLRDLADGVSVAGIARRSYVSEATVRSQVRAILIKLGVGSQLEAVAAARRSRWL